MMRVSEVYTTCVINLCLGQLTIIGLILGASIIDSYKNIGFCADLYANAVYFTVINTLFLMYIIVSLWFAIRYIQRFHYIEIAEPSLNVATMSETFFIHLTFYIIFIILLLVGLITFGKQNDNCLDIIDDSEAQTVMTIEKVYEALRVILSVVCIGISKIFNRWFTSVRVMY